MELKRATKRKAEVDGLFTKLYEDWSLGKITEYNFTMLSERFQTEQRELETKIRELQEALSSMEQTESDAEKWVELIKQYASPTELTTELLNTLIEKIVVHEAVKSPDGCRKQKVDIYYRFIGKIDKMKLPACRDAVRRGSNNLNYGSPGSRCPTRRCSSSSVRRSTCR